ncbi:hypothetical protein DPEC_G00079520 [Dallia pectoralis]|uniref:Uncharacterized protein n=1 Tax=Dallia pectoralis TaxID=75939 RepID=A0ACC2H501_DALPE|nr:hypothetical protein DPEC_G00079520 [Dallia pectoralis]
MDPNPFNPSPEPRRGTRVNGTNPVQHEQIQSKTNPQDLTMNRYANKNSTVNGTKRTALICRPQKAAQKRLTHLKPGALSWTKPSPDRERGAVRAEHMISL